MGNWIIGIRNVFLTIWGIIGQWIAGITKPIKELWSTTPKPKEETTTEPKLIPNTTIVEAVEETEGESLSDDEVASKIEEPQQKEEFQLEEEVLIELDSSTSEPLIEEGVKAPLTIEDWLKIVTTQEENLGSTHPDLLKGYQHLVNYYQDVNQLTDAIFYLNKVINIKEHTGRKDLKLILLYDSIATMHQYLGSLPQVLTFRMKAVSLQEELLGKDHPDLELGYRYLSVLYKETKQPNKALAYEVKAVAVKAKNEGTNPASLAIQYENLSSSYKDLEQWETAIDYQEKAIEIKEQTLPEYHPNLGSSCSNLAQLYLKIDDYRSAKIYIDRAVHIFRKAFPHGHRQLKAAVNGQAYISFLLKKRR